MTTYIALLRAVNVGGNGRLAMADLRNLIAELDFTDVQTVLQSGNAVFRGRKMAGPALELQLERATEKQLGISPQYLIRTAAEWAAIIAANPFPPLAKEDPSHLVVMPLKSAPKPAQVKDLAGAIRGREQIRVVGKQLYITYPDGIGTSKFTGAVIEKRLATSGTARNWNTVLKLAALCEAAG
jgi:uncharacterized protein (DUF1697 family)